jgi:hypothetical protein
MVERRFLGELIAMEDCLSRGYGDGQPFSELLTQIGGMKRAGTESAARSRQAE